MSTRGPSDFMASFGQALGIATVGLVIFIGIVLFLAWRFLGLFSR